MPMRIAEGNQAHLDAEMRGLKNMGTVKKSGTGAEEKPRINFVDRVRSVEPDGDRYRVSFRQAAAYYQVSGSDQAMLRFLREAKEKKFPVSVSYEISLAGCAEIRNIERVNPEGGDLETQGEKLHPHQLRRSKSPTDD